MTAVILHLQTKSWCIKGEPDSPMNTAARLQAAQNEELVSISGANGICLFTTTCSLGPTKPLFRLIMEVNITIHLHTSAPPLT